MVVSRPKGAPMKSKAAILWEPHTKWSVEEIELDPPGPGEVMLKLAASGLCHSDEHLVTGDMVLPTEMAAAVGLQQFPVIGGHEGAGEVVEVGAGRHRRRSRRPRRAQLHPGVRTLPVVLGRAPAALRLRRVPRSPAGRSPTSPPATTPPTDATSGSSAASARSSPTRSCRR